MTIAVALHTETDKIKNPSMMEALSRLSMEGNFTSDSSYKIKPALPS